MKRNHNQEGWEPPSSLFNKLKFSSLLILEETFIIHRSRKLVSKIFFAPFRLDRSGRGKKWRGDITLHWILCGGMVRVSCDLTKIILRFPISFVVVFRFWCTLKENTFSFMKSVLRVRLWFFMFNVKLFTEIVNQISFHWKSYFRWLWGQNWVILFRQIKSSPDSVPPIWQLQTQSAKVRKFAVFRWN